MKQLTKARTEVILDWPDYVLNRTVAASTAESITVPTGAKYVNFSANVDFYANYTTTATVPADVTDGSASELNPTMRGIAGVTTISVISASAGQISAAFYS